MTNERSCPSARAIIAAWGGDSRLRRFFEQHVQSCIHCTALVEALEKLDAAFGEGSGDVYDEIAQVIDERLASERPHRWEWMAAAEPEFHHRVVIIHLIERSDECYPSNPADGLSYADAAIAAFEAMNKRKPPQNADDALLYASALKNRATHLYLLGRYSNALCAADASANVVKPFRDAEGVMAHEGSIALARGMIYGDVDVCEYERALSEVDEAETLFAGSIPDRVGDANSMRAIVFVRSGRLTEARNLLMGLLAGTDAGSPKRGTMLQYLAWCAVLDGDVISTLAYGREALVIHNALHNRVESARAEWAIGRALSLQGEHDAARTCFDRASLVFSESDQHDLWVRVRLDYIYDLLTDNAEADVRVMCESVAAVSYALDQREPLRRHHCTAEALAYLRSSAAANTLTTDAVGYVIAYLDTLTTAPPIRFVPPRSELIM